MKYYISDLHFDHTNVIKFDNRPFNSVEEMNSALIHNWNSVVKKSDIVYVLGDFCFGNTERTNELFNQLNGKIILIRGNHDRILHTNANKNKVLQMVDYKEVKDIAFGKEYRKGIERAEKSLKGLENE